MTAFIWQRRVRRVVLRRYRTALEDITRPGVTPLRWRCAMARAASWERLADLTGRWSYRGEVVKVSTPPRWPLSAQDGYSAGHADWQAGRPPVPMSDPRMSNGNFKRGYSDGYGEGGTVPNGSAAPEIMPPS